MSVKRTVYAASSGSYSDYSVDALFEIKEDAEQYVTDEHAEFVEEFSLYEPGYRAKTVRIFTWEFWSDPIRKSDRSHEYGRSHREIDDDGEVSRKYARPVVSEHDFPNKTWRIIAQCIDEDLALKALRDRVTRRRAVEAGLA
jgi:hypothetical protein